VVPGWDIDSSKKAILLAEKYPQIVAAVGIHPTEWQKGNLEAVEEIGAISLNHRVAAIGEIGLDFFHDPDHPEEQVKLFLKMLSIASQVNKPVLIHSRNAIEAVIKQLIITRNTKCTGVLHSFEGNLTQGKILTELGYHLGVGGPLTYKNSKEKIGVFSEISDRSILLETDAPYLPPVPHRGDRNEPGYLPLVADKLAALRNQDKSQLLNQIYQNSYKMFLQDIIH